MAQKSLKLKVVEAIQDDLYKGIIRMDTSFMHQIDIRPGDIVEIEGERKTVGIVERAYPGDIGLNIIRIDGLMRRNAKTGIGEIVHIRKIVVKEAKKVIIAPAKKGIIVKANPIIFKQGLLGRPVVKGDMVSLGGSKRRKAIMSDNPLFDDVFNMLDESLISFGLGDLKFVVIDINPQKETVIITDNTEIVFNPEAIDVEEEKEFEVTYEDVGGLDEEIRKVREMVELPLKRPEIFERLGIEPPKGVLLYGPPGTGKTLLAKAVANETQSNFILINGPEIMSKYYGQSEENLRKKFEDAEKNAPSIIFIDEIDAIASKREESKGEVERRVVAQLLALMDGLNSRGKVVVMAATNIQNQLDPALRRPGRFDREIEIGVPSKEGRLNILKIHTRNMPLSGQLYPDLLEKNYNMRYKNMTDKEKSVDLNRLHKKVVELVSEKNDLASTKKQLFNDKRALENEKRTVEQKLKELESKAQREGVMQSVANLIINIKSRIEQTRLKIIDSQKKIDEKDSRLKETDANLEKIQSEIERKKVEMDRISRIRKEIGKDEVRIARNIFNELKRLDDQKSTFADIRQKLVNNASEPKIKEYYTILFDLGIISEELVKQTKKEREAVDRDLKHFSEITHGFVGADLAALAKEAAMSLLRKNLYKLKALKEDEPIPQEMLDEFEITGEDFMDALKTVRPSALREVLIEIPNIKWDDIGGLADVKQELKEAVEWPLKNPQAFKRLGIKPPKGILIYGPPGTGKTLLAKAVANESQANFILVKGPELLSKWVGESERGVRKIFEKARQASPTIIFFDEIDAIAPRRSSSDSGDSHVTEKVVNQLLTEIDGLEEMHDVVIIGATNRPDILDTALLRPGRFDRIVLAGVPDEKSREGIIKIHTKNIPIDFDSIPKESEYFEKEYYNLVNKISEENLLSEQEVQKLQKEKPKDFEKEYNKLVNKLYNQELICEKDVQELQKEKPKAKLSNKERFIKLLSLKTQFYVGADLEAICREAAILALRKDINAKVVKWEHFEEALKKVRPSVSTDVEEMYKTMKEQFSAAKGKEMLADKPSYYG